jgi:hypothetical protein
LIENKGKEVPVNKVLVHCFAGKSRATSFTLAYLIKSRGITLKDGLELIWKVRPIAAPNPGFMIQLKALEKNVFGTISECEVMQGMWKEKLDALKKSKFSNQPDGPKLTDEEMIANASGVIPGMTDILSDTKSEGTLTSQQKEVEDGFQQISLLANNQK